MFVTILLSMHFAEMNKSLDFPAVFTNSERTCDKDFIIRRAATNRVLNVLRHWVSKHSQVCLQPRLCDCVCIQHMYVWSSLSADGVCTLIKGGASPPFGFEHVNSHMHTHSHLNTVAVSVALNLFQSTYLLPP